MNTQPIEKVIKTPTQLLDVIDIWQTIQGEGPCAGSPATFIRLAGCNLQCPLCDTDYTSNRHKTTVSELLDKVQKISLRPEQEEHGTKRHNLIVLTGGEPFRQDLFDFIYAAIKRGYTIQVETNGTVWQDPEDEWLYEQLKKRTLMIVVSPKTNFLAPGLPIHALKYVLKAGQIDPEDGLPTSALGNSTTPAKPPIGWQGQIYVQPCDESDAKLNADNMQAAVQSCLKFGYKLCLQMHKYAGLK